MARKLYTVEVTLQMHVVAKNEAEARRIAEECIDEEAVNIDSSDYWVKPSRSIIESWDELCIPYGNNDEEGDRTVGEWLKIDGKDQPLSSLDDDEDPGEDFEELDDDYEDDD